MKRLPEFPEIMDKANQALTFLASGQIPSKFQFIHCFEYTKIRNDCFQKSIYYWFISPCNFWSISILILTMNNLNNKKILLIICGGIAAYKSLEIIRLLKKKRSNNKNNSYQKWC